eukprot:scaffold82383_cov28-Attheya_sp.AAC.1
MRWFIASDNAPLLSSKTVARIRVEGSRGSAITCDKTWANCWRSGMTTRIAVVKAWYSAS